MRPTKTPNVDGFPTIFFQKCWHVVGTEVSSYCLKILNGNNDIKKTNTTNIMLIPKVKNQTEMAKFKPINLCNVIYKITTKVLANRFQKVLNMCINSFQSGFDPKRLISDNILLTYELLHTFGQKRIEKTNFLTLKLDMSKIYDKIK